MNTAVITNTNSGEIYSDLARGMAKIEKELFDLKTQIFLKRINSMAPESTTVLQKQIIARLERLMTCRDNPQFRLQISSLIDDFWDLEA